jgi:outer membrane lipoprotein-sorting protein
MWARRGSDGKFFFGDFRQESVSGYTIVVNESENRTYNYNPSDKTVRIYEGLNVTIGSFLDADYFLFLQQEMENVELEYAKDKITDKEVVILKYQLPIPSKYDKSVTKSQFITFDLETKLPIRWTSWDNPYFKGEPYSEWTLIEYNPELPEDTFMFEIPEGTTEIRQ